MALSVPPPLHTAEVGTFAHNTLRVRVPEILQKVRRALEPLSREVAANFDQLYAELTAGVIGEFLDLGPDAEDWRLAVAPHVGKSWLNLPWYFAEAFFYRRVLAATGFFGSGALARVDPYASFKMSELTDSEGLGRLRRVLDDLDRLKGERERLKALFLASLWGNRVDLSYNVAEKLGSHEGDTASDLLVDDSDRVARLLIENRNARISLIADNAGTEFLMDLALVHELIQLGATVELHLKAQPTFVSDATAEDLEATLACLSNSANVRLSALGSELRAFLSRGQLVAVPDLFYTSSFHYPQMPLALRTRLSPCALVILKGDANYRRLCSDAHWPADTSFSAVVGYFPAPLVALRTLKSEVVVGLAPGGAEALSKEDPEWLVNGRRGVIQARL
ncbi:MAG: damage-control phosphatase ARMT1 family protein [Polyangiaceae bacterium]|nr:damage-control phosphatase ARMT1 family protein [Polyangiaceae bacterium]